MRAVFWLYNFDSVLTHVLHSNFRGHYGSGNTELSEWRLKHSYLFGYPILDTCDNFFYTWDYKFNVLQHNCAPRLIPGYLPYSYLETQKMTEKRKDFSRLITKMRYVNCTKQLHRVDTRRMPAKKNSKSTCTIISFLHPDNLNQNNSLHEVMDLIFLWLRQDK